MRNATLTLLALGLLACHAASGASTPASLAPAAPLDAVADNTQGCVPMTIAKGEHSGWGHAPGYLGADLIIRTPEAWCVFWQIHAGNVDSVSPPPPIDFQSHVVIATIQGQQSSGGGPNIAVLSLERRGPFVRIRVFDDERAGPLDIITNPFHIVAVERRCLPPEVSVVFEHIAPVPNSGVVMGRVLGARPDMQPGPLPGARVTLLAANANVPPRHSIAGLDGSYFFVNVPPGPYHLRAEAPGFAPSQVPIGVPQNGRVWHQFVLVPLPPQPGAIVGHVAQPLAGQLAPLPGALVELLRDDAVIASTQTNDEGAYGFDAVAPGPYVVRASHQGFVPEARPVTVAPGQTVVVDFVLRPEAPPQFGGFRGRVLGLMSNGHQVPLQGAVVRLMGPAGVVAHAVTDAQGHFMIPQVPVGHYMGVAEKPGWQRAEEPVDILPNQITEKIFRLRPIQGRASEPVASTELEGSYRQ